MSNNHSPLRPPGGRGVLSSLVIACAVVLIVWGMVIVAIHLFVAAAMAHYGSNK